MGWSFRKSKSFGPFRLNFSNSGLGVSFGVKGARINVSKRGTYVNLGANGIYYRQKIGGTKNANSHIIPINEPPVPTDTFHTITTHDVENVTDIDSRAFVDELQSKGSRASLFKWLGIWPSVIVFLYALSFANDIVHEDTTYKNVFTINKASVFIRSEATPESGAITKARLGDQFTIVNGDSSDWVNIYIDRTHVGTGFVRGDMGERSQIVDSVVRITRTEDQPLLKYGYLLFAILLIAWCIYLRRIDRKRKTIEIYYTLDQQVGQLHEKFLHYFKEFSGSIKIWQKLHVEGVHDVKYHAGASTLVSRINVKGVSPHKLPSLFLKTNVTIPCITLRNIELYFFPERLIVKRGNTFGAAFYKNIVIEKSQVRFIESETVPADATIVDHTWKYLNKNGGPDRRFSDNRQLPVCRYSEYSFKSDGGLFEVIMTSKTGAMDEFAEFLNLIGEYQKRLN